MSRQGGLAIARHHTLRPLALGLVVAGLLAEGVVWAQDAKVRVAVVDFNTEALHGSWRYGWSWNNLARAASDNLASELVKSGKFRVIERQQLDQVLNEQDLGDSGRLDPSTAARIGKVLGVQLVIIGSVTEFGISEKGGRIPQVGSFKGLKGLGAKVITGKAALTARVVDTTTAEILGAYEGAGSHTFAKGEYAGGELGTTWDSGMASKVLAESVQKLSADIAAGASSVTPSVARGGLEGKVAKFDAGSVYLNLGSAGGVKVGDRFEIRSVGEKILDPDSGEELGGEEEVVGLVEITKVLNERLSVGKVVEGGGFKPGNRAVMK